MLSFPLLAIPRPLAVLALAAALPLAAPLPGCATEPPAASDAPVGVPPSLRDAPATVRLELTAAQAAELTVETATVSAATRPVEMEMSGLVEASPEDFAAVSAPISGRIVRVLAHEGEAVRRGQTVAVIESLEFASLVADLMQAGAEADLQRQQVARYTQLVAERISPQMRLDQARADLRRAEAAVQGARARLSAVGVGEAAVREAARSGRVLVSVAAPRSGLIDRHSIDLGGAVMAYDEMMTIVGQSEVMVRGQASPDQAARIRPGDGVSVRSAADSSVAVAGRVSSIAPAATADDRAVAVYVRLPAGRGLRPGQSVRLSVVTRDAAPGLEVPLAAISYDGDRAVVFVQTGPRAYELRPVVLGAAGEASASVRDGLRPGERVAVSNVFDLKALTRFDPEAE